MGQGVRGGVEDREDESRSTKRKKENFGNWEMTEKSFIQLESYKTPMFWDGFMHCCWECCQEQFFWKAV